MQWLSICCKGSAFAEVNVASGELIAVTLSKGVEYFASGFDAYLSDYTKDN